MTDSLTGALDRLVRDVPDFPTPGVVFKDITPLLADPTAFAAVIEAMAAQGRTISDAPIDAVVGMEARGFILAAPVALALGAGFVPVRKAGKLPHRTTRTEYALEYGTDVLEVHTDACPQPARVLLVDDVLATGGTAAATCRLVEGIGAELVGCAFLVELGFLNGAEALAGRRVESLVRY